MKLEDLKNTKIYLSNEEDRVKFQKKMFKLGVLWKDGFTEPLHIKGEPFYYINSNFQMTKDTMYQNDSFKNHEYEQIFLHDVLSIEEPKIDFKPFDKVLVRDFDNERWKPRLFAWHYVDYDEPFPYPFETTDGRFYSYCIPYDENLANTTKSKDE